MWKKINRKRKKEKARGRSLPSDVSKTLLSTLSWFHKRYLLYSLYWLSYFFCIISIAVGTARGLGCRRWKYADLGNNVSGVFQIIHCLSRSDWNFYINKILEENEQSALPSFFESCDVSLWIEVLVHLWTALLDSAKGCPHPREKGGTE